jgi:hypothetical protein
MIVKSTSAFGTGVVVDTDDQRTRRFGAPALPPPPPPPPDEAAWTAPVDDEVAPVSPSAFEAVTTTSIVCPMSPLTGPYVVFVPTVLQVPPVQLSQA